MAEIGLGDRTMAAVEGGGRLIGKWEWRRDFGRGEAVGIAILWGNLRETNGDYGDEMRMELKNLQKYGVDFDRRNLGWCLFCSS